MAEWVFGKNGSPDLLFDDDCLRNNRGTVIAWIFNGSIYSLQGSHVGWYENGILYDTNNMALGFLQNCKGALPSRPGLSGTPGLPGFSGRPGRPGFSGVPGRPGKGGWSQEELSDYFENES